MTGSGIPMETSSQPGLIHPFFLNSVIFSEIFLDLATFSVAPAEGAPLGNKVLTSGIILNCPLWKQPLDRKPRSKCLAWKPARLAVEAGPAPERLHLRVQPVRGMVRSGISRDS